MERPYSGRPTWKMLYISYFPFNKDSQIKPFFQKNSGVISGKLLIGEVAVKADGKTEWLLEPWRRNLATYLPKINA